MGRKSGLTLLLPHAYEGQGPEHSSARLERFLQLAAEHNWTVANLSSTANYFHLLRRQAQYLGTDRMRPLVIMSPKAYYVIILFLIRLRNSLKAALKRLFLVNTRRQKLRNS